jgi:recombination protein RecA
MSEIFEKLQADIKKNVKGAHVSVLADSEIASNRFWVSTPALDLNRILSGSVNKGIQSRNLVAIVGPEHTMKSSFMVLCMANAQKQGYKPVIIDTEGGITKEFCERWGLDTNNILYIYTPWIHEVKSAIAQIRETGEEGFIIGLDSVGGLDRYKSFDDALKGEPKADQGLLQKEIRSTLKLLLNICVGQNSIGIACGHYYGMPATVPMPDQIGGGKAMKLFPSIIITLKKQPLQETKGGPILGNNITATTIKNRIYPPYQQATVWLDYKNGIEENAGLVSLALEAGILEKKGAWYSYKGESIAQGEIKAVKALSDIKGIIDDIDKWIEDTGYSTVNKQVEEAAKLIDEVVVEEEKIEEKPKKTTKRKALTKK